MENKKLLKFLLKDLSELDELFTENGNNSFDDLEMEFIQTRVKGAKKLVQILFEREGIPKNKVERELKDEVVEKVIEKVEVQTMVEEKRIDVEIEKEQIIEKMPGSEGEKMAQQKTKIVESVEEVQKEIEVVAEVVVEKQAELKEEVELEEEKVVNEATQRLGDSFSKEKSVNDLMAAGNTKLEHKLSNRPVSSIQLAIGINDRFQYIRELFDGDGDSFTKAVSEIDAMKNINEAVEYLQQNFNWKKNDISLNFVNLVKRRFPNE